VRFALSKPQEREYKEREEQREQRLRIYLDTSVPSMYFNEEVPILQGETRAFWEHLGDYEPYISDLVREELEATPDPARREALLQLR